MRIELEDENACVSVSAQIGPTITDLLEYLIIPSLLALGFQRATIDKHINTDGFDAE